MSTPSLFPWQNKQEGCLAEVVVVTVTKMHSQAVVVLSTETAMETRVVIPGVEAETALEVFLAEAVVAQGEVVSPTGMQIHAVTKEDMEEGISHNRMALGTQWEEGTTTTAMLIHSSRHPLHHQDLPLRSLVHLNH